jgi:hypothetical protein
VDREQLWERLVESLNSWTSATEIAAGRIEVVLLGDEAERRAVIVMTPDEWDEMAAVMWGNVDDAVADVKRTLGRLRPDEQFAVYEQYRLEPSSGPTLPEDAETARMEALLRLHPGGFGRWNTTDPTNDGRDRSAHGSD